MSVRRGLLALLAEQPMHGYQLRQEFEARTGGTWPLNIGQVYTTVQRLVRDGLVEPVPAGDTSADGGRDGGRDDVERFRLTAAGRAEAAAWWTTPVQRGEPARDELVIKLALAVTAPSVDVRDVVQRQRTASMRALHEYTRLKQSAASDDLAWSLVLDNLVFTAEAEVRWLDHVEARVARVRPTGTAPARAAGAAAAPPGTTDGDVTTQDVVRRDVSDRDATGRRTPRRGGADHQDARRTVR